jgi:hypothetical protein
MPNPTRTARVASGITESGQTLFALLTAAGAEAASVLFFTLMEFENLGDVSLMVATTNWDNTAPSEADYRTIASGDNKILKNIATKRFYIKTEDVDAASNAFEINGDQD